MRDRRPLRVLHAFNRHRGGGGSDNAWDATIALSREAGLDVHVFERSSRDLAPGLAGRVGAFASGIYARETVRAFDATLQACRPDIVHTHELYPLISPWIVRQAALAGVPVVHSCYDFRLTCPTATHARQGRVCTECLDFGEHRAVLRNCRGNRAESAAFAVRSAVARRAGLFQHHVAQFIVLSPFSRDWLVDHAGIDPARITVNGCAIALPPTAVAPGSGRYVGYAGRFVPEKGVETLVAATRRAGLPLRLAGDAATHPAIRAGDDAACVATGSPARLAEFYRGATMLVVPSHWFETFAIVAAEAMAHGVPVVASDIGALADTVQRDRTGLLVPPGDVTALAGAIRRLWDDPALAARLGAAGRERIRREFGATSHIERLLAAYDRAAGRDAVGLAA